jgi:hypothetical protein
MLDQQLPYLAGGVSDGDFAPTTQQQAVRQLLAQQVQTFRGQLDQLMSQDLAQFNAMLRQRNIGSIVLRGQ